MEPTFSPTERQLIDECNQLARERFEGELEISLESDDAITWDAILIAYPSETVLVDCSGQQRAGALAQLRDKLREMPLIRRN